MEYLAVKDKDDISELKDAPPEKVHIEIVKGEAGFYELSEDWSDLAAEAKVPVYMSHEWAATWWKHFGKHPKRELFLITVYLGDELIGIAPFFIGESSIGSLAIQRRLHLMGSGVSENEFFGYTNDYGYSDFLDVIAHPDYEDKVADALVEYIQQNKMGADVLCLQHVSDESFVVTRMLFRLKETELNYGVEQTDECPYISLPDSMDTYLDEIGSSSRRRRFRKNLEPAGKEYNVEEVATPVQLEEGIEILHKLHQDRWNAIGYPGAFFDTRYHDFVKEISKIALEKGWLWFKTAEDKEGVAALRWALKYNNQFFDCATAFDTSSPSAQHSPGLGLLAILIDDGIKMNASRIELLRGTERYKFDFTKKSRKNWRIKINYYDEKSKLRSILNGLINTVGNVFRILEKEWELLQVHRDKAGLLKMFYSYGSFRYDRLKSKLEQKNIFSNKDS